MENQNREKVSNEVSRLEQSQCVNVLDLPNVLALENVIEHGETKEQ